MSAAVEAGIALARSIHGTGADHEDFDYYRKHVEAALTAALPHLTEELSEFIDGWYDRWAGPGESWTAEDLAAAITEELKRRIEG